MESSKSEVFPVLSALAVFKSTQNEELIRSFHVYRMEDGKEVAIEREFLFSPHSYVETVAVPLLEFPRNRVSELFEGKVIGIWHCILAYDINREPTSAPITSTLLISRNPMLKSVPTLVADLQKVYPLRGETENKEPSKFAGESCGSNKDDSYHSASVLPQFDQDLNRLPHANGTSSPKNQQDGQCVPENINKKKRKIGKTQHLTELGVEGLVKYFELPLVEAAKSLNVSVTILKKKCRELGIPRWPHRKIKSLGTLINDLQEEAARQERENQAANVAAVIKRQKMLETEKEIIEKQPVVDIQSETKKFRQDVFKRRHTARARSKNTDESQVGEQR